MMVPFDTLLDGTVISYRCPTCDFIGWPVDLTSGERDYRCPNEASFGECNPRPHQPVGLRVKYRAVSNNQVNLFGERCNDKFWRRTLI